MRKHTAAIMLFLLASVCAQHSTENISALEMRLLKAVCNEVKEGDACRIPYPYSNEFSGICCGGLCRPRTLSCDKPSEPGPSLFDAMKTAPCRNKETGEYCDIPQELKDRFGLSGVCCYGECIYWRNECYPNVSSLDSTKKTSSVAAGYGFRLLLPAVVILLLISAAAIYFSKRKKDIDYNSEISRLVKEKKRIEEMIELAKSKYHRRVLDEDSFREIVKENQKKLIEIEARINDLEERMKRLEKSTNWM